MLPCMKGMGVSWLPFPAPPLPLYPLPKCKLSGQFQSPFPPLGIFHIKEKMVPKSVFSFMRKNDEDWLYMDVLFSFLSFFWFSSFFLFLLDYSDREEKYHTKWQWQCSCMGQKEQHKTEGIKNTVEDHRGMDLNNCEDVGRIYQCKSFISQEQANHRDIKQISGCQALG